MKHRIPSETDQVRIPGHPVHRVQSPERSRLVGSLDDGHFDRFAAGDQFESKAC